MINSYFNSGSNTATIEHNFTGRKPSKTQIMAKIKPAIKSGARSISIIWGENWLELDHLGGHLGSWAGAGWIRDISGDDIARELNNQQKRG